MAHQTKLKLGASQRWAKCTCGENYVWWNRLCFSEASALFYILCDPKVSCLDPLSCFYSSLHQVFPVFVILCSCSFLLFSATIKQGQQMTDDIQYLLTLLNLNLIPDLPFVPLQTVEQYEIWHPPCLNLCEPLWHHPVQHDLAFTTSSFSSARALCQGL